MGKGFNPLPWNINLTLQFLQQMDVQQVWWYREVIALSFHFEGKKGNRKKRALREMPREKPTWLHPALTRGQGDEEHLTLRPDIWIFLDATCSKMSSHKGGHHHFPVSMRILFFKFEVTNYLVINNLKQIGFMQSKKQRTNTAPSY